MSDAEKKRKKQSEKTKGILDFLDGDNTQHNTQSNTQKDTTDNSHNGGDNVDDATQDNTQTNILLKPKKESKNKRYNVYLDEDLVRELDYVADKVGMSRSKIISKFCSFGLDRIKIEKPGL